jgi:hypothetical protein
MACLNAPPVATSRSCGGTPRRRSAASQNRAPSRERENGTRNFNDAASQTAWRTPARSRRSTSVTSHASPATSVDATDDSPALRSFGSVLSRQLSSVFSALTSSSDRRPDSTRCAITGWIFPPKKFSSSSMSRRCVDSREIAA